MPSLLTLNKIATVVGLARQFSIPRGLQLWNAMRRLSFSLPLQTYKQLYSLAKEQILALTQIEQTPAGGKLYISTVPKIPKSIYKPTTSSKRFLYRVDVTRFHLLKQQHDVIPVFVESDKPLSASEVKELAENLYKTKGGTDPRQVEIVDTYLSLAGRFW